MLPEGHVAVLVLMIDLDLGHVQDQDLSLVLVTAIGKTSFVTLLYVPILVLTNRYT